MSINLSNELKKIMDDYSGDVKKILDISSKEEANEVVKELKNVTKPKRTGKYSGSWKIKTDENATGTVGYIIYNEKYYRLTHLLEFGHATVNGGRVPAQPHIKPIEEKCVIDFERRIKEAVNRIGNG